MQVPKFSLLVFLFLAIPLGFALEPEPVKMHAEYVEFNLKLQTDGTVDFSQIVRGNANKTDPCDTCVITIPIKVDDEEILQSESIFITDLNTGFEKFVRVSRLTPPECIGQYEFDYKSNDITICINNSIPNSIAYQVKYTYEPHNPQKELCDAQGIVARPVRFEFNPERFPDTFRFSLLLAEDFAPWEEFENCSLNKSPIKEAEREVVCVFTREEIIDYANKNNTLELNITLRGETAAHRRQQEQENETRRENILLTVKTAIGAVISAIIFFGVLRTKLKNRVYNVFREGNLREQVVFFTALIILFSIYCFLLIWWKGEPFI